MVKRFRQFWRLHLHVLAAGLALIVAGYAVAAPPTFELAKIELRQHVYHDQHHNGALGTIYCGCDWRWLGRSGGRVDFASCGYEIRAQEHRGVRTEWEHIIPASNFGRARQCWQDGGRNNCRRTDPVFNIFEADMHNLTVSVGEINADRSNYRFGVLPTAMLQHGACDFRVDFSRRIAEPRDEVKGLVARVYFYIHDRYDLRMSEQQQRLLMAWDHQFPVTTWERERDRRITARMGHSNPFVTGARQWAVGHSNSGEGVRMEVPRGHPVGTGRAGCPPNAPIRGDRDPKVYHLPVGCPSYDQVSLRNVVEFASEAEAQAAGYRRANCR